MLTRPACFEAEVEAETSKCKAKAEAKANDIIQVRKQNIQTPGSSIHKCI